MGFFGKSRDQLPDYDKPVAMAEAALRPQVNRLLVLNPASAVGMKKLTSDGLLFFLHGFIRFYSKKCGFRKPGLQSAVTYRVLINIFGEDAATEMSSTLGTLLLEGGDSPMLQEGENAAAYYEKDGLRLVAAFLGEAE